LASLPAGLASLPAGLAPRRPAIGAGEGESSDRMTMTSIPPGANRSRE
jgi:hypothetical protein